MAPDFNGSLLKDSNGSHCNYRASEECCTFGPKEICSCGIILLSLPPDRMKLSKGYLGSAKQQSRRGAPGLGWRDSSVWILALINACIPRGQCLFACISSRIASSQVEQSKDPLLTLMSHLQFHFHSYAKLYWHGLIFETSESMLWVAMSAVEPSTQRTAQGWLARPLRVWFTRENHLVEGEVDMWFQSLAAHHVRNVVCRMLESYFSLSIY